MQAPTQPTGLPVERTAAVDVTALVNTAVIFALGAFVVLAASGLQLLLRDRTALPAREVVRAGGHEDPTPREAFQHAEGATAWTRMS